MRVFFFLPPPDQNPLGLLPLPGMGQQIFVSGWGSRQGCFIFGVLGNHLFFFIERPFKVGAFSLVSANLFSTDPLATPLSFFFPSGPPPLRISPFRFGHRLPFPLGPWGTDLGPAGCQLSGTPTNKSRPVFPPLPPQGLPSRGELCPL